MRKSFRALAIAAAVAATPMAFAQDNTANATTPHRFSVVGGYAHMVPKSDPGSIAGSQADLDGNGAPTLSGSWFATDNIAVEVWGAADRFETDANLANATFGARWYLTERFVLRADYTLYTAFVSDQRSQEFRAVTAGISFFFY